MSVYNNLLPASFNNVNFLVPDESKSSGKKTIKHDYPNSNRRFVEELGVAVPEYSITAIVSGIDAVQKRIRLETELSKSGRGLLIHPVLGQLFVVATDYQSSSSDTKIGEFVFNISFSESVDNISLTPSVSSVQLISSLIESAKSSLDSQFVSLFSNTTFPDTISKTSDQLTGILSEVGSFTSGVSDLNTVASNALSLNVSKTLNSVATIARQGGTIASQLRSNYELAENISDDIPSFFNSWLGLTGFGLSRKKKPLITQKRIVEENNLGLVEEHTQINALLGIYESAAYKQYETDIELSITRNELEDQYNSIIDNAQEGGIAFSSEFRELISNIRVRVREVLEEKEQNVWRVVDIDAGQSSMAITAYRYYNSLENLETIIDLNKNVNVSIHDEIVKGVS